MNPFADPIFVFMCYTALGAAHLLTCLMFWEAEESERRERARLQTLIEKYRAQSLLPPSEPPPSEPPLLPESSKHGCWLRQVEP